MNVIFNFLYFWISWNYISNYNFDILISESLLIHPLISIILSLIITIVVIVKSLNTDKYLTEYTDKKICQIIGSCNRKNNKHKLVLKTIDSSYPVITSKNTADVKKYYIGGLVNVYFKPNTNEFYIPDVDRKINKVAIYISVFNIIYAFIYIVFTIL